MDILIFVSILLGLLAGILINYLSDVLPVTRRFSQPACHHCSTPYLWSDYLLFRACPNCGTRRSLRTWLVLVVAVAFFIYFWLNPPSGLGLPLGLIVLTYFGLITVIDLEHRLILHPTSLFGAILGLIAGTYLHSKSDGLVAGVKTSLLGGVAGFAFMFVLYQIGAFVARIRARRMQSAGQGEDDEEALGGGDVYLTGVLGLMLGWPHIILGLMYGILIGGAVSLVALIRLFVQRRYAEHAMMTFVPYGPSLILGVFYVLYFY